MTSPCKGQVLIINNNIFDGNDPEDNRPGSDVDVANLKKLFTGLGFEVNLSLQYSRAAFLNHRGGLILLVSFAKRGVTGILPL